MFSLNAFEESKIIEICFIAGVNTNNIPSKKNYLKVKLGIFQNDPNSNIYPDILFSFPDNKDVITPNRLNISYVEENPKVYGVVLTNEKGVRSYVYVLKFYEKIFHSEIKDSYCKDIEDKLASSFNRSTIHSVTEKFLYFPIAICIWSYISKIEFFKEILQEIYEIINMKNFDISNFNVVNLRNGNEENSSISLNKIIRDYQHCELINYFIFLTSIVKPSSYTHMKLNLRYSQPSIYFPSIYEIPPNNHNMKILFNTLEVSVIIKLWVSILTEKHIIILANQNFLLFSICEALINLIFPFKWLHTYIPVLSSNQLDYLESPTPYIMGVHSNYTDFLYLKDIFPNHVICDVNTSQIYGNLICSLPTLDEVKLRKKLFYVKNPEIYNIEEISNLVENGASKTVQMEDISVNRQLGCNLQYIFFRIFRTYLGNLRKYIKNKVFDTQKFLDDFLDDEYREFWGKIINTIAFEYFILSDQYLDDSNIKIFENILDCQDEEKYASKANIFEFEINIPEIIDEVFNEIINYVRFKKPEIAKSNLKSFIVYCNKLSENYSDLVKLISINKNKALTFSHKNLKYLGNISSSMNKMNLNQETSSSSDLIPGISITIPEINSTNYLKIDNKVTPQENLQQSSQNSKNLFIRHSKNNSNLLDTSINSNKISNSNFILDNIPIIKFYSSNDNSFFKFINEYFEVLSDTDSIELGFFGQCYKNKRNLEIEQLINLCDYKKNLNTTQMSRNYTYFSKLHKIDCYQFFLLVAFSLEESQHLKDIVFENYVKACLVNYKSFPRIKFLQFLNLFENKQLKLLQRKNIEGLLKKIINYKINRLTKASRFKIMVLDSEDYFSKKDSSSCSCEDVKFLKRSNSNSNDSFKRSFKSNQHNESRFNFKNANLGISSKLDENKNSSIDLNDLTYKNKNFLTTDYLPKIRIEDVNNLDERKTSCSFMRKRSSCTAEVYDYRTNAGKIIQDLKLDEINNKDKLMKLHIINNYSKIYNYEKDPLSIAEDIAIKLLSFINRNSIDKIKHEMFSSKYLMDLQSTPQFLEIKSTIAYLQKINLSKIYSNSCRVCFWLNIFNFLTIFTLIYKKEILSNYYEWYRFLKNSYFNVGGFELSLYEIQNCILTQGMYSLSMYGERVKFPDDDPKNNLSFDLTKEPELKRYIIYGITFPTKSAPNLSIYFPSTVYNELKVTATEYLTKNINIDFDYKIISIGELILWSDPKFKENINYYKDILPLDLINYIQDPGNIMSVHVNKFEWTLNFCNYNSNHFLC